MTDESPKVSIIIPVFNAEAYLDECLDSLQQQTLADIEILCIDDGSSDACPEILHARSRQDSRVVVIQQANGGPAVARNTGLSAAQGKYIGFVDSDDWVELNYFETLYKCAEARRADLVRTEYFESSGTVLKPSYANQYLGQRVLANQNLTVIDHLYVIWNALYRKDYLDAHKIAYFDKGCDGVEDVPFSARATYYSRLSVPAVGTAYYYRKNVENQLTTVSVKRLEHTLVASRISADFFNSVEYETRHDYLSSFKKNLINLDYWHRMTLPIIRPEQQSRYFEEASAITALCKHPDLLQKYYPAPFVDDYLNADLNSYLRRNCH